MIGELIFEEVSKSFGGIKAVDEVTLRFRSPTISGIIGPNGAGKSTLLNLASGFLTPDAGRCLVSGVETSRLPPHQIARLGMTRTFQDLRLIREMSAQENVMLAAPDQSGESPLQAAFGWTWLKQEGQIAEHSKEILRRVGLTEFTDRPAGELSYGQKKLLSLACAISSGASILLLDEPVAGVHPAMIEDLLLLLEELRDEGKLVVLIEHDLDAVRHVADQVIVMDHGRVLDRGPADYILGLPEVLAAYVD